MTASTDDEGVIGDAAAPSLARFLFMAEEFAWALAVSTTLVRQLTLSGDLPCRRIGRFVRYTTADIESFVHSFDDRVAGDPAGRKGSVPIHIAQQATGRTTWDDARGLRARCG